jgi:hypothetical protein
VRHVRQSSCPARFADVVVDVHASAGAGRVTVDVRTMEQVPEPVPPELLDAFRAGLEHHVRQRPDVREHDIAVVLRRVVWHHVDSMPSSFRDVAELVVDRISAALMLTR